MRGSMEAVDSAMLGWVSRLVAGCPEAFEGQCKTKPKGPTSSSHETCIYGIDGARVHVKFFGRARGLTGATYDPRQEMKAEYNILKEFEKNGFNEGPYRVVRALGTSEALSCALATVYVGGDTLLSIIQDTLTGAGDEGRMLAALDLTAGLLKKIHAAMPQSPRVDAGEMFYSYLKPLLYLEEQDALDGFHRRIARALGRWNGHKPLFEQAGVTAHGDANPSNFKIGDGVIYAFDVEHSRPRRSPLLDVGMMVAELRHHCAYIAGDPERAGPYVERFLRAYAPAAKELLPFYVSRGLFKIAMLGYWKRDYKKYLVEQGTACIEEWP